MQLLLIDNMAAFYWLDKVVKPAAPAPGQSRHNMCVLPSLGCSVTDMHGCSAFKSYQHADLSCIALHHKAVQPGPTNGASDVVGSIVQLFVPPALSSLLAANLFALWVRNYAAAIPV